jgi:hypothetical protein
MKSWKKLLWAVVFLGMPGLAWAADALVTASSCPPCCPFCP